MAKNYRSAQGKVIDMASLAAKNEKTRAVGINMKVNARGDTIDQFNKIVVPVTQKVGEKYHKTVGNKSAQPKKTGKPTNAVAPEVKAVKEESLTSDEIELQNELDNDDQVLEKIKNQEDPE